MVLSHNVEIKVLAEMGSSLEAVGKNPLSGSSKLLAEFSSMTWRILFFLPCCQPGIKDNSPVIAQDALHLQANNSMSTLGFQFL